MKLVLIRHGWPDEGHNERPHDPPLRAEGLVQAKAAAEQLAHEGVTRIVSSPLLRAHQTAEVLADRLHLPIETIEGWAEADRHLPRYRSAETLRGQGEIEWQRFLKDPLAYLGVDPISFRTGVLQALNATISKGDKHSHIAIFTHGLPINLVLSNALGIDRISHFRLGYCSLTRLQVSDGPSIGVVSVNELSHHAWHERANS